ncbi:MAG: hypothetical protein JOZ86_13415, partial [Candidatus Eremiobacteraeota bacterium]|nr:hypothetical protein [Candidatus Eremiobacteraeota bacterium]
MKTAIGWRKLGSVAALALAFAASGSAASAETTAPGAVLAVPALDPPTLDPKADIATWKDAASVTLPWDVQDKRA